MMLRVLLWSAQVVAACVLFFAASSKFADAPHSVAIFEALRMEPFGRYLVACIELLAGLFLVTPMAAIGAVLAIMVMTGAVMAHLSTLGLEVADDGGLTVLLLVVEVLCAGWVGYMRRRELPLIGPTL